MTPEANPDTTSEPAASGAQEARNTVAIVSSLWEKFESLVQLELKLALAEAEEKVSALKRDVFAEAETKVSALKRDVFTEAETKVSALKRDVFAEAETKVSALKVEVFAEADDRITALKRELTAKAVGGSFAFASVLALVGALIALLALVMEVWISALLIGSVLAVASFLMLRRSLTLSPQSADEPTRAPLPSPTTTKESSHGTI